MNSEYSHDEKWLQLRTTAPPERAEWCAQILLDEGCQGAQIDDTEIIFDQSEDAQLRPRERAIITAFLPIGGAGATREYSRESVAVLEAALREYDFDAPLEVDDVAAQDWANNWRQNFPPLDIPPFRIVATWHDEKRADAQNQEIPNDETIELVLDPGLAFGTGQHPTTRLCLQLLASELREYSQAPCVLDVGCGSGVLSIAAAKLGARVWASDLDPFCTRATRENAALNNVKLETIEEIAGADWSLQVQPQGFDVVVANLMSALLIALAPQLFEVVQNGGKLIVSGISAPRADDVENALHEVGFRTVQKREEDGETRGDFLERWTAFVFGK